MSPEHRAPWGATARAQLPTWVPDPAPASPTCPRRYPTARERVAGPPPAAALKYERIDGPATLTTAGDTDALLFAFSGRPDSILLSAQAFGALFTLTDRLRRESTVILVPAGESIETYVARDTVLVRNAVAASNALVTCVGKWAMLDEPSSAD
jgi:hypothetical protein